jgi:hypothetical protein
VSLHILSLDILERETEKEKQTGIESEETDKDRERLRQSERPGPSVIKPLVAIFFLMVLIS